MSPYATVPMLWNYCNVLQDDGMRYGQGATVRSLWIIRHGEDFPRFTSCYVL